MSATLLHAPFRGVGRVRQRPVRGFVKRIAARSLAAVHDWRNRVHARQELLALDDRTLHDLGLSRSDIDYLTTRACERDAFLDSLRFPPF
jgi:uncharacterized protein YjiS (DUF1127 family)